MFSLYYQVANAILRQRATVAEYTDEAVRDPEVLALCKKVKLQLTPEFAQEGTFRKTKLEIRTKRGSFSKENEFQKGHPRNPMTWEEHIEKMKNCTAMVARPIPERNLDKLVEMIANLEQVEDVTQMVKLVVG